MKLLWLRLCEGLVFAAWACTGFRPGRLSGAHYRSESRLRNEENR